MNQNVCRALGVALALLLLTTTSPVASQQIASLSGASERAARALPPIEPSVVLSQFISAEAKVRDALNQHTFKRDVVLQTIGPNGEVTGEYIRNSQFVFDNRGRRIERVLYHPKSTISEMRITKEDIQDLAGAQLLGIDVSETTKYQLTVIGMESVDHQQLIAIDVSPTTAPDPHRMSERYFVGRVWVDPGTFQIAKVRGTVEPQGKQRFPLFETWREQVKSEFAFPTRTEADDVLHFRRCDVHYRIKVRYYDYQLFGSRVEIKELDDVPPEDSVPNKPVAINQTKSGEPSPTRQKSETVTRPTTSAVAKDSRPTFVPKPVPTESCTVNRNAPPIGPYYWPVDTQVKVYFLRNVFSPDQRAALLDAMFTWTSLTNETGSGVKFVDAGEADNRQTCAGCLTIRRSDVYKYDKHHYAFFYPMNRIDQLIVSAWIELDNGITKPQALKAFMMHELGHGLGLWDCTSCKNKQTLMNFFPGMNKDNGLASPSRCDVATVREVYQQARLLARTTNPSASAPTGQKMIAGAASAQPALTPNLNELPLFRPNSERHDETTDTGFPIRTVAPFTQPTSRPAGRLLFSSKPTTSNKSFHFAQLFWSPSQ